MDSFSAYKSLQKMCLLPATAPKPFLPSIALSSLNCRQSSMSDGAPSGQEIATATRTSSPRLDALKSWLAANNVHLSAKLEIRSAQSDGNERTEARQQKEQKEQHEEESFAIYALRDIQQDEILAVTPRSAILSRRTCSLANAPAFHRLCAQVEAATPQQAGVRILATALTHEILLGEHSRWHAYILSMPQSCAEVGLSTFWDDGAALSWLRGTDVLTYMTQQKCTRKEIDAYYHDIALPYLKAALPTKKISQEVYNLAFSLALSRAFYVDNYHGLSMVPLADAFNHHFHPHATLQSDDIVCPTCGSRHACAHDDRQGEETKPSGHLELPAGDLAIQQHMVDLRVEHTLEDDAVEMIATDNVTKGSEVLNTYGKLDNASLLVNYGFMLEANEDDKVRWFSLASVIRQAGLWDDEVDIEVIDKTWRSIMKNRSDPLYEIQDERISTETLTHPHIRQPHELLFIDADGAVSIYLLLLSHVVREFTLGNQPVLEDYINASKEFLETLIRSRLELLAIREPDIDVLFDLVSEATTTPQAKLAISRVIDERLLLTACIARWSEDEDSLEEEE